MGSALGSGFTNLANDLALAAAGVALLATVALGFGLFFSIWDHQVMAWFKNALLRIIGGSAIVGGAAAVSSFIVSNFKA